MALLRDGVAGVEVYLQRRRGRMAFGGAWVFPGGRVDPADRAPALDAHWDGPDPRVWAARLGVDVAAARGAVAAAVRETLEEAGVLLADRPVAAEAAAAARSELLERRPLADVLASLGVRMATGRLRYWAWWVTPEVETRRFDTRFFVVAVPADIPVAFHAPEADVQRWLPVAAAAGDEALPLAPPTRHTLQSLAGYATVAEALAAGEDRQVERVMPVFADGGLVLPWGERVTLHPGVNLRMRERGS